MSYKIGFAGTDGRTLLSAIVVATAKSQSGNDDFHGVVIRGTPAMPEFAKIMNWPISFIPTTDNSVASYATAIVAALKKGVIDCVIPMPEDLLYQGLVDEIAKAGFGNQIAGFSKNGTFMESDKITCKKLCRDFGVPVADAWREVDARNYSEVLRTILEMIDNYGGAVIKYPYSAGGKGSHIILDTWQIKEVYDILMAKYTKKTEDGKDYVSICGNNAWPLLIESRMSGAEISFTVLVDKNGNFQILPTAMDYPERFAGPASKDNPITGGMASLSPHPMDSVELTEMARKQIIEPFIAAMRAKNILRSCVLYPGCIISFDSQMRPRRIRMCEMNIRPGEPEFQPVVKRLRNLGHLVKAMFDGNLNEIVPEVRQNQISISIPLVIGKGGPSGQKGYPWSYAKGELVEIDFKHFAKNKIQLIPSGMGYDEKGNVFKSEGTRIVYMDINGTIKPGETMADVAKRLREKLLSAFDRGKIRVIPRENPKGNRLDLRRDVGEHYLIAEKTFLTRGTNMNIFTTLKSAVGKKVTIAYSVEKPITEGSLSKEKQIAEGMLTEFDEIQYEAELDNCFRIGTQVIDTVTVLS